MRSLLTGVVLLVLIVLGINGFSQVSDYGSRHSNNFWDKRQEGYFWYQDPLQEAEQRPPRVDRPNPATKKPMTATERMLKFRKFMEEVKALAILEPSKENVTLYLKLKMLAMNQASVFADQARRVGWQNAGLNYSLRRPTAAIALNSYKETEDRRIKIGVKETLDQYGIFFFFKGSCPYCHKFGPLLKAFSKRYNVKVVAISLDGGTLPDYQNPSHRPELARTYQVTSVPSVFLVNPKKRKVIPVTHGLISYTELEKRVFVLTKTKPGQEF